MITIEHFYSSYFSICLLGEMLDLSNKRELQCFRNPIQQWFKYISCAFYILDNIKTANLIFFFSIFLGLNYPFFIDRP